MAQLDAFSAQIVKFVRQMPDDALLDLVKQKLGVLAVVAVHENGAGPARVSPAAGAAPRKGKRIAATAKRPVGDGGSSSNPVHRAPPRLTAEADVEVAGSRSQAGAAERQDMLDNIERIVKAGAGLSASDVARLATIPQTRAAAALKELKLAKRIFQGGDRRFARYAGDSKVAEQASTTARKSAKGPTLPIPANGGRTRKRPTSAGAAPA